MTAKTALLWKEWRQQRAVLIAGLAIFLGLALVLPWMAWLVRLDHRIDHEPLIIVIMFLGPLLAILAGSYGPRRELHDGTEAFWRSRPVELGPWLLTKYLVGLAAVSVVVVTTIAIGLFVCDDPPERIQFLLITGVPMLALVYSLSFLAGCVVSETITAMLASVGVAGLVHLAPAILPLPDWMAFLGLNLHRAGSLRSSAPELVAFAAVCLACSVGLLWICRRVVGSGVRIELGQRAICWAAAICLLLLVAAGASQVTTNMTCLATMDLPGANGDEGVCLNGLAASGTEAWVLSNERVSLEHRNRSRVWLSTMNLATGVLDSAILLADPNREFWARDLILLQERPAALAFVLHEWHRQPGQELKQEGLYLCTVRLDGQHAGSPTLHKMDLAPYLQWGTRPRAVLCEGRVYLYDVGEDRSKAEGKMVVLALDDTGLPIVVDDRAMGKIGIRRDRSLRGLGQTLDVDIVDVEGLGQRQRLELTLRLTGEWPTPAGLDRDLLVASLPGDRRRMFTTHLLRLTDLESAKDTASFTCLASRALLPVEGLSFLTFEKIQVHGDLAYCQGNLGLTVFGIEQGGLNRLGHFAAGQGFAALACLPHGRILLGGTKLWLVASPRAELAR